MATKQYISYSARGGSGGGVSSLNTLTGAVVLAAGSGITITPAGNTLTIAATLSGAVTNVSASSPLFSSGGSTPNLTIQLATGAQDGYLSSTDWNTFNNKQPALGFTPENSANKGIANGYASLDAGGKVPTSQLPSSVMEYQGTWDAATNTPTLADGVGDAGDVYIVSVAGTQDLGSGPITFAVSDWVIYNGSIWQKSSNTNAVNSVNGLVGTVVLTTTNINEGTNLYFTDERAQDAVGTILANTNSIDLTYVDGGPSISADVNVDPDGPVIINPNGLSVNVANGVDISVPGVDAQTSVLLHFDNNLTDSSTYAFTVVQDGATGPSYVAGKFSQALDFTAANTGFSIANAPELQFGSGDFTVECWLMPTISGDSNNHQFLNKSNGTTTDWFFIYFQDQLRFGIPGLSFNTAAVPVSIEDGNWHHVAFVRSGTDTYMFLDGNVIDSSSVSGSVSNTSGADLGIGHFKTNFSEQYFGLMDEVRISKGVARWTSNFTPPVAPYTNTTPASIELEAIGDNTVLANKSGGTASPTQVALSDVVETVSNILTITNGSKAVVASSNLSIEVAQANTTTDGYLSSTDWNTFNNKQAAGNYITDLTGDATASGPGSAALTLATVNGDVGSFGSSTAIPSFTVNAKGLITAASTNVVIAPAGTLTGTTLAANVVSSSLTSVGAISSGTWNGTAVDIAHGGTGEATAADAFDALSPMTTSGDIIYGGASGTGTRLPVGSNGTVLVVASGLPSWGSVPAGSFAVTGPKTTTYSISSADNVVTCDSSGGTFTITLPTAVGISGHIFVLKKIDSSLTAVTVDTTSSQTIDGALTTKLSTQGETLTVVSDGANYQIQTRTIPSNAVSYTPTFVGFGTTSNAVGWWKRNGDSIKCWGSVTVGTGTAVAATVSLPTGAAIATSLIGASLTPQGHAYRTIATDKYPGLSGGPWPMFSDGSATGTMFFAPGPGGSNSGDSFGKCLGSDVASNGKPFVFSFEVPISGWSN